ncbi:MULTISPECIES: GyrI-like domain-containing protein [Jannaschia]|nr:MULTISPECIES: AraC family transcriptional regulator [unclassified Jannaschia]
MTTRHPQAPRIDRVMTHIHRNLVRGLSLDELADVAALSRFHFSRVFHEITGEGVSSVVRRIRLNRAAALMVTTDLPVVRVGQGCGYVNVQSFERAFRRAFGVTPLAARAGRRMLSPLIPSKTGDWTMYPVETRSETSFTIAALSHRGAYTQIGAVFQKMDHMLTASGQPTGDSIGIYYDSPQDTAVEDLRSHAGRVVLSGEVPPAMERVDVEGGDFAVLTHVGPYLGLPAAWHYMFNVALSERNLVPRAGIPFERYLNNVRTTPVEDLVTEVCVPVTSV